MFKLWKFALFFLLCLIFALVVNLPVRQVLPHLMLPANIKLAGVQGTLFEGTAQEITVDQFPLRGINYRYLPSCIALLKACYQVNYDHGTAQLAHDVINGDTEISHTRVEYLATELVKHVPNVPVNPVGRLELVIDNLSMVQGKPTAMNGKLVWSDMGIDNDGSIISIGDYQVEFTGDQQKLDFKLSDLGASLDVAGKGEIRADGLYHVDIKIEAAAGIDPKIKNVLDLFTDKDGYNKYRVEQRGRLPPNLTRQLFQ